MSLGVQDSCRQAPYTDANTSVGNVREDLLRCKFMLISLMVRV